MNVEKIFSTEERIRILKSMIYLEKEFGVNEIAKKSKLSKGLVSKYFNILVKEGILKKSKAKLLVEKNSFVKGIKIMLNMQNIDVGVFKEYKSVKSVGLYGSCAKGTNTENSDIDLWIKTESINDEEMPKLTAEVRNLVPNAKILMLDKSKINALKEKDSLFYHALYFGSIIIYGEEYGI